MASTISATLSVAAAIVALVGIVAYNQMELAERQRRLGTFTLDSLPVKLCTMAATLAVTMYIRHCGMAGESALGLTASAGQIVFHSMIFALAAIPLCFAHVIDSLHAQHRCGSNRKTSTLAKMLRNISSRVEENQKVKEGE